jgi:N-acetylglucosamine-6-phosphate deacetylase
VDAETDLPSGDITIEDGRILAIGTAPDEPGRLVEATGCIVLPGFIDVHTHGGGGRNLHTADPEEILAYARWAPRTGVTAFLIGTVGVPGEVPESQLLAATAAINAWHSGAGAGEGAQPLGIHLEGPYISPARRGAHPLSWLREPNPTETEHILALAGGHLRLVTLAPELPGAHTMIRTLVAAGVTAAMGHTDATYEQALEAIALGVTHATHCCNAMRPLLHRDPGPLGAIALSPGVGGELIADGVHVHPAMAQVLIKMIGAERVIIITDAQAGAGIADGAFEFAGQPVRVVGGAARLADDTLAGSVLTMDQALRNACATLGASLSAASGMLSRNPARSIRADDRKGLLAVGYDADLALLDAQLALRATFCRGTLAYGSDEWTALLGTQQRTRASRRKA